MGIRLCLLVGTVFYVNKFKPHLRKENRTKMNKEEKMEIIADILELEVDELNGDMQLEEIEAWDSVAVLSVISVMDEKFGKLPHASEIIKCKKVSDLLTIMQ